MSIRDQILAAKNDSQSETVDVPEWGVKLVIRELNVEDRGKLIMSDFEQVETANGWELKPKFDAIAAARVVVCAAYDEDGTRVFEDGDADQLARRAFSVVDRLATVARRLSNLGNDPRASLIAIQNEIQNGADLNRVGYLIAEALDPTSDAAGKAPAAGSSPTPPAETPTP